MPTGEFIFRYKSGDIVSAERWDRAEPDEVPLGECRILRCRQAYTTSGEFVTIVASDGRSIELDRGWLTPVIEV